MREFDDDFDVARSSLFVRFIVTIMALIFFLFSTHFIGSLQ